MATRAKGASTAPASDLERGRRLYGERAWDDAYQALARADAAAPLDVEDLERLGWAAALTARDQDVLRVWERQYQAHVDRGETLKAARKGYWLGMRLFALGEAGRAGGWLARAERLAEGQDCVERGYLMLPGVHRLLAAGDAAGAEARAAAAAEIGDRFREPDLASFARALEGRAVLRQGRVARGLALLDEAMVAATTGELSPVVTALTYCNVIGSCQQVYALDRSREWTATLSDWCRAQPQLVAFTGTCLVHRAEVMQLGGAWLEASQEARRAGARQARTLDADAVADASYQQAEIHRLRGEHAEAEEAYRSAGAHGREPQPGLALLRLAQGRRDDAAAAVRRVLAATADRLKRARFLPAHVEIMLAVGDVEEARRACVELEEIAAAFPTDVLAAMAGQARGDVELAAGEAARAVDPLRLALRVWQQLGAPYIAARVRLRLGAAFRALGDEEAAATELGLAREVFERLGAASELAAAAPPAPPPRPDALTAREVQVLRLVATGKTNKAIARELFLSEKTIDRHVSNIFTKIDVASRAAATAYAYQRKLV